MKKTKEVIDMFHYYQPTRIHFGEGLVEEAGNMCKRYGTRCLLVTTPDAPLQPLYERVKTLLQKEGVQVVHFDEVEPNPSVEIVERGFALLKEHPCDVVLAVGGGSSIDTAKAIAFANGKASIDWDYIFSAYDSPFAAYSSYSDKHLPLLSIPTTSGTGSQVTQAAVITRGQEKITFFHPDNFSKECILDPNLMLTLPKRMSAATGFDAFTHAFESFINPRASHYSRMDSLEAMRLVIENLPRVMEEPQNIDYHRAMCLADTLAGRALANSGASAPHPLSEIIGGIVHMTHGEALAVVFPPFIHHTKEQNKEAFRQVAALFHADDLETAMNAFLKQIGLDRKMKDYGISEEQFQTILDSPILDHLPFGSRAELETILQDAYA